MYPGSTIANGHQRYSHGQWDVREVTEGVPGKLIQKCLTSHSALGSLLRENTPFLPLTTHTHTLYYKQKTCSVCHLGSSSQP